jgi:putative transposase
MSRFADVGPGLEAVRSAVELVSVLFTLHQGDAASWAATGEPGPEVPSGWTVTAARFEVEWPSGPGRQALVRSHFGARRFAYNWGLARVKADLDARENDPGHQAAGWDHFSLRKAWNQAKDDAAPWWRDNSKEAYSCGLADLAAALGNWRASRDGTRKGRTVGFPRFKSSRKDARRVRFTTGAMRLEPDRRTITLPVIGGLHARENTRRVERHLAAGRARVLSMTLSERWGRLFVPVSYALRTPHTPPVPVMPGARAGVDLGLRVLATVSAIDPATGKETIREYPNPAPLRATLRERRKAGRQMTRRVPGSRGWREAKAKLARLDRRCVHLRTQACHQLTTSLARTYGEIVIEDLDVAGMKRGMGRRAFRRAVSDAAIGQPRPMLSGKARRHGSTLIVADRWYPSSQLHHGHLLDDGTPCRLRGRGRIDKMLRCPVTGELVDRDANAARNLRDWPGHASRGLVEAPAPHVSTPGSSAGDGGPDPRTSRGPGSARKTTSYEAAAREEATTRTATRRNGNPARGRATSEHHH